MVDLKELKSLYIRDPNLISSLIILFFYVSFSTKSKIFYLLTKAFILEAVSMKTKKHYSD